MPKSRDKQYEALREEYKDLLWTSHGKAKDSMDVMRDHSKYWEKVHNEKLIDFQQSWSHSLSGRCYCRAGSKLGKFHKEWGEELDFSLLEKEDVLLFRLFTTPSAATTPCLGEKHRIMVVYTSGDGWMLHHPYNDLSQLADLTDKYNKIYCSSCMGAIYKKDR